MAADPVSPIRDNSPVPIKRTVAAAPINRWTRRTYRGIKPATLQGVLQKLERGDLEDWADLAAFMLRHDGHLKSIVETRTLAVAGSEIEVTAGRGENEALDLAGAEFCLQELTDFDELEGYLSSMLNAENVGWAAGEHGWHLRGGEWHSFPMAIPQRDFRFGNEWQRQLRTYADSHNGIWLDADTLNPAQFMFHIPIKSDTPNLAGDLLTVSWQWLFKRWAEIFRQTGLERFANPFMFGTLPANATAAARTAALNGLQNLSGDQVAVFEDSTGINILEMTGVPGEAWNMAIDKLNNEMSKALLGSTLNVEVITGGANRALGESQFSATILPRLVLQGKRLASTIEQQWFRPLLAFNSHLFGGQVPATPNLRFRIAQEELAPIDDLAVASGVVTKDELRVSRGLPPLPEGAGGDELIEAPEPPQPAPAPPAEENGSEDIVNED